MKNKTIKAVKEPDNQGNLFDFEPPQGQQEKKTETKAETETTPTSVENTPKTAVIPTTPSSQQPKKAEEQIQAIEKPVVVPVAKPNFDEQRGKVSNILGKLKVITTITNDETNKLARELAVEAKKVLKQLEARTKEINQPHKDEVTKNSTESKEIGTPLDNDVERVNNLITAYEVAKEKARQAELKRIEDEKAAQKVKDDAEKERISKINLQLEKLETQATDKSNNAITSEEIEKVLNGFDKWTPNPDFYQEFLPEANALKIKCLNIIKQRQTIILDLEKIAEQEEKLNKKATKLSKKEVDLKKKELDVAKTQKVQEAQKQIDDVAKNQEQAKVQAQFDELSAKEDLITLGSKLQVPKLMEWVEKMIERFGTAKIAMEKKETIINEISHSKGTEQKVKELSSAGMKNIRTDLIIEIINPELVPREYLMPDEKKIKEAVTMRRKILLDDINSFKIEGVKISTAHAAINRS